MKRAVKKISSMFLAVLLCLTMGVTAMAQDEPVASGSVGLSFEGNSVLVGENITGSVYSYDIGGSDAFSMTFTYDAAAFTGLSVEGTEGVTVLAVSENDNQISAVFMVDPDVADYQDLLRVTVTAGSEEATGSVAIAYSEAAKKGGLVETKIVDQDNTISVFTDTLIDALTIQDLSLAMTYFLVDRNSPEWPGAAKYDLEPDGVIDISDFIKIANAILDAQRIDKLTFNQDGTFKIMQMSDIQDYISILKPKMNAKTKTLMEAALDEEQPDLVVITGDQVGGNMNATQLEDYLTQIVQPMEERGIPWLVTYGNHDEDATAALSQGWDKIQQLAFHRTFEYNINRATMSGAQGYNRNGRNTHGVGDMYTLIYDSEGNNPVYNVWALDSNMYDDSGTGIGGYDWIRPEQVDWYYNTSQVLEAKYGKLNALMFYHIPTPEWVDMYNNKDKFGVTGEKNEDECPPNVNSGLFVAALDRGDVKGMFVGHDHVNNYLGNYYGITLGYDANVGYQTYGLNGTERDRLRGVRIFELDINDLETFETRMVYASDLGVNQ